MVRCDTVLTGVQVFVVLIALSLLLTGCTEVGLGIGLVLWLGLLLLLLD